MRLVVLTSAADLIILRVSAANIVSASPPTSADVAGHILLVEEYDALAVAIGSVLKKFAPRYRTHVAKTFASVEALAAEFRPDLLIVDFDPPQPGAVEFFTKLKLIVPETRVLIIAAGMSREVLAAHEEPFACEFVQKPFELSELGRAIEVSLAPRSMETLALREIGLAELLPLLCSAGVSTALRAESADDRDGEIHLAAGQIVHAAALGQIGVEALREMLSWPAPRLDETERAPERAGTIDRPWQAFLLDAFQHPRTRARTKRRKEKASRPAIERTKKIVVIDDTELLLIFVEDVLATAAPEFEIITAGSGLDGLTRARMEKPDAVLLDFSLPDITGDEVCRGLLEDPATADIPVIMMSGHVPEMMATAQRYRNVVATIAKPFLSLALIDLVRTTLAAPRGEVGAAGKSSAPIEEEAEPEGPLVAEGEPVQQESPQSNGKDHHVSAETDPAPPAAPTEASPPLVGPKNPSAGDAPASLPSNETPRAQADEPITSRANRRGPPDLHSETAALATVMLPTPVTAEMPDRSRLTPAAVIPRPAQPRVQHRAIPLTATVAIPAASNEAVILGLALEVLAMQFSPTLRMASIRARPCSSTVSLHLHPEALSGLTLPEAGFELGRVDLNARGHLETVRLTPTRSSLMKKPSVGAFRVSDVALLPFRGGGAMELTPSAMSRMTMQLFASFELAAVELSPTFGVGSLVLRSRGAKIRVSLQPTGGSSGATFESAQILLDHKAQIAEILLDAAV